MNQNKWKKIIGIFLVLGVLVLSFWYGGNAPGLQGFYVEKEVNESAYNEAEESVFSDVNDNKKDISAKEDDRDSYKDSVTVSHKKKKTGFLSQIVMKIKKLGSSGSKKKNLQINKKAQKNANKAVDKKNKTKKKKSVSSNDSTTVNDDNNSKADADINGKKADNNIDDKNSAASEKNDTISDDPTDNKENGSETASDTEAAKSTAELETVSNTETTESEEKDDDVDENSITCHIYISCASVLDHMDKLSDATKKIIPADGVILKLTSVKVKKDATVFDVLQKAARQNKVHLEYNYTPAYKTYYIEGIGNLYQFDAGNLSGWMYSVNDEFPGVGCSGYKVKDGDSIKWLYTCSFGKDVGGYVSEE